MIENEKRKAIVIWREAIEDALFCVPRSIRGEVLAELLEKEKERAAREPFAVWTMADLMKPCESDGLLNHIAEATSLIVQVLVRSITNHHSAKDAAKILFRQHRHGTGGRWLPDYLRDLPGIEIDRAKAARISDENGKSNCCLGFQPRMNPQLRHRRNRMKNNRSKARQNLLVSIANTALERRLITLACEPFTDTTFEYELAGLPVIADCVDIGYDEVTLRAICCPTAMAMRRPSALYPNYGWREFGAAVITGCLERRTGKYLQSFVSYHGSKEVTAKLALAPVTPLGFSAKPKRGYDVYLGPQ